ncbi:uncharacterized protein PgNI_08027 [Pyricularia grisea]|uniref:Lysine-specific metallo-endopeptidase domain-containing protein n=1 Tax=Pyricularia grisea TaxID=148305 RepID=A0A6P8AVF1_PYRGI|nr:uncharacterized protein PgNI_08027 [Pyricularia grisea]TLD06203.1 hypothetical protein PgNI_08027 [Pyricularia grisea]
MNFLFIFTFLYTIATSALTNIGPSLHPVHRFNNLPNHNHGALNKRAHLSHHSYCSESEISKIQAALQGCDPLARYGFHGTKDEDWLFQSIFKTDSTDIKSLVKNNFDKLYDECSKKTDTVSITCRDVDGKCEKAKGSILGHAKMRHDQVVLCPSFFDQELTGRMVTASYQDTTLLHEIAHIVLDLPDDYAYGYDDIVKLDTATIIKNPDSYAIFAHCARYGICDLTNPRR